MNPIETPTTTDVLLGPEGSEIEPLPVKRDGDGTCLSYWKPSMEDRRRIAEGGLIGLIVGADPQPPVGLVVTPPWSKHGTMTWSERLGTYVCVEDDQE
jgi:hypothetical protein